VSLVCVDEKKLLVDIERLLKRDIDKVIIPGYEPDTSIRPEPIINGRNRRPSRQGRFSGQRSGGQHAVPQARARRGNGQGRRSRRAA
jgi:ATP-dependent RNA helicase RhlE